MSVTTKQATIYSCLRDRRQVSPEYFRERIQEVARKAAELYNRAAAGDLMTIRDLALAMEYNQQYIDLLDEMQDAPVTFSGTGCVKFE